MKHISYTLRCKITLLCNLIHDLTCLLTRPLCILFFFCVFFFFFFNDTATTEIYTPSLHDALPIWREIRDAKMAIFGFIPEPKAECIPETGLRHLAIALVGRAAVGGVEPLRAIRPDTHCALSLPVPGANLPFDGVSEGVVIPDGESSVAGTHHQGHWISRGCIRVHSKGKTGDSNLAHCDGSIQQSQVVIARFYKVVNQNSD